MKHICNFILSSLLLLSPCVGVWAQKPEKMPADTATAPIYQGLNIKLDLGNSAYEVIASGGDRLSFEGLVNVNLRNKFFPTIEAGYAQATQAVTNGATFSGNGAFARAGMDLNMMKNSTPSTRYNLFCVGLRMGMAFQNFDTDNVPIYNDYWGGSQTSTFAGQFRADAWGEVLAGIQVEVCKGFHMGWCVREKILFTRGKTGALTPWYIPGFGRRNTSTFGFNYYIGLRL